MIAINTGVLALIRPQPFAGGLVFRIGVSKAPASRYLEAGPAELLLGSCALRAAMAPTFQRGRWQCVD